MVDDAMYDCYSCSKRLEQQLEDWKNNPQEHLVTILLTSADMSFVEFQFIDPGDGVSEWTYWLMYETTDEDRRRLGEAAV